MQKYTIGFTVKDARELHTGGNLVDPFVVVRCAEYEYVTETKVGKQSIVTWNESQVWSGLELMSGDFETLSISFKVMARNWFSADTEIGEAEVQLHTVNCRPNHSLVSRWVPLKTKDSAEAQGSLCVTLFCVGPGDSVPSLDELEQAGGDAEGKDADEGLKSGDKAASDQAPGSSFRPGESLVAETSEAPGENSGDGVRGKLVSAMLRPASSALGEGDGKLGSKDKTAGGSSSASQGTGKCYNLYVTVHQVRDLPFVDLSAFTSVDFMGVHIETPVSGQAAGGPLTFESTFRVPVTPPLLGDSVVFRVWRFVAGAEDGLLAQGVLSFSQLRNRPLPPRWFYLYSMDQPVLSARPGMGGIDQSSAASGPYGVDAYVGRILLSAYVEVLPDDSPLGLATLVPSPPCEEPRSVLTTVLADFYRVSLELSGGSIPGFVRVTPNLVGSAYGQALSSAIATRSSLLDAVKSGQLSNVNAVLSGSGSKNSSLPGSAKGGDSAAAGPGGAGSGGSAGSAAGPIPGVAPGSVKASVFDVLQLSVQVGLGWTVPIGTSSVLDTGSGSGSSTAGSSSSAASLGFSAAARQVGVSGLSDSVASSMGLYGPEGLAGGVVSSSYTQALALMKQEASSTDEPLIGRLDLSSLSVELCVLSNRASTVWTKSAKVISTSGSTGATNSNSTSNRSINSVSLICELDKEAGRLPPVTMSVSEETPPVILVRVLAKCAVMYPNPLLDKSTSESPGSIVATLPGSLNPNGTSSLLPVFGVDGGGVSVPIASVSIPLGSLAAHEQGNPNIPLNYSLLEKQVDGPDGFRTSSYSSSFRIGGSILAALSKLTSVVPSDIVRVPRRHLASRQYVLRAHVYAVDVGRRFMSHIKSSQGELTEKSASGKTIPPGDRPMFVRDGLRVSLHTENDDKSNGAGGSVSPKKPESQKSGDQRASLLSQNSSDFGLPQEAFVSSNRSKAVELSPISWVNQTVETAVTLFADHSQRDPAPFQGTVKLLLTSVGADRAFDERLEAIKERDRLAAGQQGTLAGITASGVGALSGLVSWGFSGSGASGSNSASSKASSPDPFANLPDQLVAEFGFSFGSLRKRDIHGELEPYSAVSGASWISARPSGSGPSRGLNSTFYALVSFELLRSVDAASPDARPPPLVVSPRQLVSSFYARPSELVSVCSFGVTASVIGVRIPSKPMWVMDGVRSATHESRSMGIGSRKMGKNSVSSGIASFLAAGFSVVGGSSSSASLAESVMVSCRSNTGTVVSPVLVKSRARRLIVLVRVVPSSSAAAGGRSRSDTEIIGSDLSAQGSTSVDHGSSPSGAGSSSVLGFPLQTATCNTEAVADLSDSASFSTAQSLDCGQLTSTVPILVSVQPGASKSSMSPVLSLTTSPIVPVNLQVLLVDLTDMRILGVGTIPVPKELFVSRCTVKARTPAKKNQSADDIGRLGGDIGQGALTGTAGRNRIGMINASQNSSSSNQLGSEDDNIDDDIGELSTDVPDSADAFSSSAESDGFPLNPAGDASSDMDSILLKGVNTESSRRRASLRAQQERDGGKTQPASSIASRFALAPDEPVIDSTGVPKALKRRTKSNQPGFQTFGQTQLHRQSIDANSGSANGQEAPGSNGSSSGANLISSNAKLPSSVTADCLLLEGERLNRGAGGQGAASGASSGTLSASIAIDRLNAFTGEEANTARGIFGVEADPSISSLVQHGRVSTVDELVRRTGWCVSVPMLDATGNLPGCVVAQVKMCVKLSVPKQPMVQPKKEKKANPKDEKERRDHDGRNKRQGRGKSGHTSQHDLNDSAQSQTSLALSEKTVYLSATGSVLNSRAVENIPYSLFTVGTGVRSSAGKIDGDGSPASRTSSTVLFGSGSGAGSFGGSSLGGGSKGASADNGAAAQMEAALSKQAVLRDMFSSMTVLVNSKLANSAAGGGLAALSSSLATGPSNVAVAEAMNGRHVLPRKIRLRLYAYKALVLVSLRGQKVSLDSTLGVQNKQKGMTIEELNSGVGGKLQPIQESDEEKQNMSGSAESRRMSSLVGTTASEGEEMMEEGNSPVRKSTNPDSGLDSSDAKNDSEASSSSSSGLGVFGSAMQAAGDAAVNMGRLVVDVSGKVIQYGQTAVTTAVSTATSAVSAAASLSGGSRGAGEAGDLADLVKLGVNVASYLCLKMSLGGKTVGTIPACNFVGSELLFYRLDEKDMTLPFEWELEVALVFTGPYALIPNLQSKQQRYSRRIGAIGGGSGMTGGSGMVGGSGMAGGSGAVSSSSNEYLASLRTLAVATIDVESRWYSYAWQSLSEGGELPVESVELRDPDDGSLVASLSLMLDMVDALKASLRKPLEIAQPVSQSVHLRVIVWEVLDLPIARLQAARAAREALAASSGTNTGGASVNAGSSSNNDDDDDSDDSSPNKSGSDPSAASSSLASDNVMVRASLDVAPTENFKPIYGQIQDTDVHYNCTGDAVYNYRLVYDCVKLPVVSSSLQLMVMSYSSIAEPSLMAEATVDVKSFVEKVALTLEPMTLTDELPLTLMDQGAPTNTHGGQTGAGPILGPNGLPIIPKRPRIKVTVQLMLQNEADLHPAGTARNEPNANPTLIVPLEGRGWSDVFASAGFTLDIFNFGWLLKYQILFAALGMIVAFVALKQGGLL